MMLTPIQALQILHDIAEQVPMKGPDRDKARECTKLLSDVIEASQAKSADPAARKPDNAKS